MSISSIFLIILSYLVGSINSAIIICKILKLPSPRSMGSGNPGTTNVLRLGGKKAAILTLAGDLGKGLAPVIFAHLLNFNITIVSLVALASIVGHIFPIFFKFKGGKGIATLIGASFGLNLIIGTFFILTWILIAIITKYSSLSAIIATLELPVIVLYFHGLIPFYIFLLIALIVLIRHKDNIIRLISKQESKIGSKK